MASPPPPVTDSPEKTGLRNAWGRVAAPYDALWSARLSAYAERCLTLLAPPAAGRGLDVACGPGLTTRRLAELMPRGEVTGIDFAPEMVARAREETPAGAPVAFAVGDAERMDRADASADVVTCHVGLMYCYDARSAVAEMARVVRPGGRVGLTVWGRARRVWWSPIIESIESRAAYFSAICPMMFFYGLSGVLARMLEEVGLVVREDMLITDAPMRYSSAAEATEAAVLGMPLAGLFHHRLDDAGRAEVRAELAAHCAQVGDADGDGLSLPAEVRVLVAERPAA
jgi:ubiquinone/menaquinone biosynthesis C-methylase UbiE